MGGAASAFTGGASDQSQQFTGGTVQPYYGPNAPRPPSVQQMQIKLSQLVQQGQITPEQAHTYLQEASAYENIDPRLQQEQMKALDQFSGIVDTNGLDPQAKAALYQMNSQNAAQERGQREAILQNAAARGVRGSGLELGAQLANQQGSATRGAAQGFQAAADANQRKLQAIQGLANTGGQIWGQQANQASAQNAINQFNANNRQNVENMNVAGRNAAQAQNLAERQRISDTNTGLRNQQQLYNKGLYQQNFANQMALAGGQSGANSEAAKQALDRQNSANQVFGNIPIFNLLSDRSAKEDIKPIDASKFLEGLKGYSYKYKNQERDGKGKQVGVMAQDIEKIAPQAVIETKLGKAIRPDKLTTPMLAGMASLHERLKKLEKK